MAIIAIGDEEFGSAELARNLRFKITLLELEIRGLQQELVRRREIVGWLVSL